MRFDDVGRFFLYRPTPGDPAAPPEMWGPRSTDHLTRRAARKIKGAALKAHDLGLGMRTFVTFTCGPEDRERVARGKLVLGREMKRTLNAMQQRFRREGYSDFAYIWVAENPGDDNPHVHLLTNHRVPRSDFLTFAQWVESLWGHGFAHMESIQRPECAGRYILKAVGYAAKGDDGSQGTVRGNRYGISRNIMIKETTADIEDCESAAQTLGGLMGSLPSGSDIEPLGSCYLTRYGLAFPARSTFAQLNGALHLLEQGAVPD